MNTLLLRLTAPLQSWGVDSKFENRRGTERVPSKSGVLGMIAAALGRKRNEELGNLETLRFGIRIDREGTLLRDYHTAKGRKDPYVTHRYYLADAVFLAGLEGNEYLLEDIDRHLRCPVFPLYLGRRSCPPEGRLSLGVRKGKNLVDALREEPWLGATWKQGRSRPPHLRVVTDACESDKGLHFQRDVPISFDQSHRRFGFRKVVESVVVLTPEIAHNPEDGSLTEHDPMSELEG